MERIEKLKQLRGPTRKDVQDWKAILDLTENYIRNCESNGIDEDDNIEFFRDKAVKLKAAINKHE